MHACFLPGVKAPERPPSTSFWFCFRDHRLLLGSRLRVPRCRHPADLSVSPLRTQYLGTLDGSHCFSAELPSDTHVGAEMAFHDIRELHPHSEGLYALAGYATQIMDWDRTHQFCGTCGSETRPSRRERARVCCRCESRHFPRLTPAIIVAVEWNARILLARSSHFPQGIYSVLAGFVEPGESLEMAVRREVREETGIILGEVRYFASQPWPFPNSLMVGFVARYSSGGLTVNGDELEDAGWYEVDNMPPTFPDRLSISQWLIDDFVARQRPSLGREPS